MAKRMVDTNIWLDTQIADDFTKNDILLWIYLLTSPHTSILGITKCNCSLISFESKLESKNQVLTSLNNLEKKHGLIKYNKENDEILILNWYKHNWTKSNKLINCLKTKLSEVKTQEFQNYINKIITRFETL